MLVLIVCGCSESDSEAALPPASQYHVRGDLPPLTITFPAGDAAPYEADRATLKQYARALQASAVPVLYASGNEAQARAHVIAHLLQHPVDLLPQPAPGMPTPHRDVALLTIIVPSGVTADACRGPGARTLGDLWPGDDPYRAQMLPPGCSTEAILQAQTAQQTDLVQGRALGPAAASPYAQAIERYYQRNDKRQPGSSEQGSSGGGGSEAVAPSGGSGNPLLGGLPAGK